MKAYSPEFRRDVLAACDAGGTTRIVALNFKVSESWVRRIKQERREHGKIAPLTTRRRIPKWAVFTDRIIAAYQEKPDRTLKELKAHLQTDLSLQTLCCALRRLKLTIKKSDDRFRTRSARRCRETCRMDCQTGGTRPRKTGFHRRNMGKNEHDAASRTSTQRQTSD